MKKLFTVFMAMVIAALAYGQNAIVGDGFTEGWGTFNTNQNFEHFSASAGGSFIGYQTGRGTGNQYFRLGIDWGGSVYQITHTPLTDVSVSPNTPYFLTVTGTMNGAMFTNVTDMSHNYIFKTRNAGTSPSGHLIFFKVEGTVRSVSGVNISPTEPTQNEDATVTATLDGALSAGQSVYLRYTTNNFSNSTVVEMTGSGTTYTASIPAQSVGTSVNYYVFTSGNGLTIAHGDADFYTINLNNNSGSNYSYVSVVPVELTAFTATPKQNEVLLAWETKTELNNGGFEVQRAADGRNFETLATIEGAGTTIEAQKYAYTDAQPLAGVSYYRLKQMDFDGTTEYSQILTVKRENAPQVALFPNPTTEKLTLRTDVQGTANIRIFDLNGRLVYERAQRFDNQLDLNVTELVAGQYFLEVRNNDTQATIYSGTFVKQ